MSYKKKLLILILFILPNILLSQLVSKGVEKPVFVGVEEYKKFTKIAEDNHWYKLTISELMGEIGNSLKDTPYKAGTLECKEETCIIDFTGMDCVTFVENVMCLARNVRRQFYDRDDLTREISFIRYRGGNINGYLSRLHYTSDWIKDNISKGIVEDITQKLGGEKTRFSVYYMSHNHQSYPALKENPELLDELEKIESKLSISDFYYLPKNKIEKIENQLKTGDIVAIVTSKSGLDYAHIGIIYKDSKGVARLLHASSTQKKVVLDESLSKYMSGVSTHTGITILRLKEINK